MFGNQRQETDFDKESNLSLSLLKEIWGRTDWIVYFAFLEASTLAFWWFSTIVNEVCMERVLDDKGDAEADPTEQMMGGGRRQAVPAGVRGYWVRFLRAKHWARTGLKAFAEGVAQSQPDVMVRKVAGMCWAITGGVLAGTTLVLAKSGVKLVSSALEHADPTEANPLTSPLSWLIIVLLIVSAVAQVVCLNKGLKAFDSTLIVPTFFCVYTISGFINSLVYLDEGDLYTTRVFACIVSNRFAPLIVSAVC